MTKKRLLFLIFIVICLGVVYITNKWWHSPASTYTSDTNTSDIKDVLGSQSTLIDFVSPYFSTSLPSFLQKKTSSENPHAAIKGSYLFKNKQLDLTDQLAITIGDLNGDSLESIGGVKLRKSQPSLYSQTYITNQPANTIVFKQQDPYEVAIFWQNGQRYAAVVVSGKSARRSELDQLLVSVIKNWQWR